MPTEYLAALRDPATGAPGLACLAKRTYALQGDRLRLADAQLPLVLAPELAVDDRGRFHDLLDDTDVTPEKPATDVIVTGTVRAPGPVTELPFAVAVGKSARALRAVGERFVEVRADGSVRFTPPAPFEQVTLGRELAYGGYDAYAQRELAPFPREVERRLGGPVHGVFAYPRNAVGRAYFLDVDPDRADGARLPLLEDPADPLTPERLFVPGPEAWIDAPIPASLGWVPYSWYPRLSRYAGPTALAAARPARPLREAFFPDGSDLPGLAPLEPGRAHPRAVQGAAPGLACERLRGDELCILRGFSAAQPEQRFSLPGERPALSLAIPGLPDLTPAPVLNTVRIFADRGLVALTWGAVIPLHAFPADETFLASATLRVRF